MRLRSLPITPRLFHRCVIASFICLYLLAIQYCRINFYMDPTSAFFDPVRGYDQVYSRFRTSQASNFIRQGNGLAASPSNNKNTPSTNASATLCVGVASIAREISYVEATIGSLLLDLTAHERSDIHLIVFIPHTDPTVHPSYASNWMSVLPDTILLYDLPESELDYIKHLETEDTTSNRKGIFDYAYLLKACHSIGTPYVIIIEDDVIAVDGWYHRTLQALKDAEAQTRRIGASNYLYLRLFYTHKFLGWNKEEDVTYAACSIAIIATVGFVLLTTRRCLTETSRYLSNRAIGIVCFVFMPLIIMLFFAAGRASMLPIPEGIHQMRTGGCCSQAQAFPRDRVFDVVHWYESRKIGYADSLLEEYADAHDEVRWAVAPSLFPHIGSTSSKDDDINGGKRIAKSIWNFEFERNDPIVLQREHELAVASQN